MPTPGNRRGSWRWWCTLTSWALRIGCVGGTACHHFREIGSPVPARVHPVAVGATSPEEAHSAANRFLFSLVGIFRGAILGQRQGDAAEPQKTARQHRPNGRHITSLSRSGARLVSRRQSTTWVRPVPRPLTR